MRLRLATLARTSSFTLDVEDSISFQGIQQRIATVTGVRDPVLVHRGNVVGHGDFPLAEMINGWLPRQGIAESDFLVVVAGSDQNENDGDHCLNEVETPSEVLLHLTAEGWRSLQTPGVETDVPLFKGVASTDSLAAEFLETRLLGSLSVDAGESPDWKPATWSEETVRVLAPLLQRDKLIDTVAGELVLSPMHPRSTAELRDTGAPRTPRMNLSACAVLALALSCEMWASNRVVWAQSRDECVAQAVCDFTGEDGSARGQVPLHQTHPDTVLFRSDRLSFRCGQLVRVLSRYEERGWWGGELLDAEGEGVLKFPADAVRIIKGRLPTHVSTDPSSFQPEHDSLWPGSPTSTCTFEASTLILNLLLVVFSAGTTVSWNVFKNRLSEVFNVNERSSEQLDMFRSLVCSDSVQESTATEEAVRTLFARFAPLSSDRDPYNPGLQSAGYTFEMIICIIGAQGFHGSLRSRAEVEQRLAGKAAGTYLFYWFESEPTAGGDITAAPSSIVANGKVASLAVTDGKETHFFWITPIFRNRSFIMQSQVGEYSSLDSISERHSYGATPLYSDAERRCPLFLGQPVGGQPVVPAGKSKFDGKQEIDPALVARASDLAGVALPTPGAPLKPAQPTFRPECPRGHGGMQEFGHQGLPLFLPGELEREDFRHYFCSSCGGQSRKDHLGGLRVHWACRLCKAAICLNCAHQLESLTLRFNVSEAGLNLISLALGVSPIIGPPLRKVSLSFFAEQSCGRSTGGGGPGKKAIRALISTVARKCPCVETWEFDDVGLDDELLFFFLEAQIEAIEDAPTYPGGISQAPSPDIERPGLSGRSLVLSNASRVTDPGLAKFLETYSRRVSRWKSLRLRSVPQAGAQCVAVLAELQMTNPGLTVSIESCRGLGGDTRAVSKPTED